MTTPRDVLTRGLVDHGYWIATGAPGIFGRTARFNAILEGFDALVIDVGREAGAERVEFPPVMDREILRRAGFMESFPELCGSIHGYRAAKGSHLDLIDRVEAGGDWTEYLEQLPLTLSPAACYPLYPSCTGRLPAGGRLFDLSTFAFRAEPSDDPARLQAFRQHENVRLGAPEDVRAWRDAWSGRGLEMLGALGLDARLELATDPFFGRGGRLLAANQLAEELKFEVVVPITSESSPTALCSFNYHEDKFARAFDITTADGGLAHSACIGFGLERVVLALLETHGFDLTVWPARVREAVGL
ncbi:MAG: amino acid--[acyl-carrier-protein] ligase [Spirochaetaceae bacterium]|nr:amino acid--[acyl-carrier-protein] ligase [Myxococcales bacterium]MCB9725326.1 amino acid--[acyl-carrier-protein] ligase [Spirochaetaceae bacterium]HPG25205.1 amino acid--[acyl-carrier-protein] ligase [Myxococcota bacterium]